MGLGGARWTYPAKAVRSLWLISPGESLLDLGVPVEADVSRDNSPRLTTCEHIKECSLASSRRAHEGRHLHRKTQLRKTLGIQPTNRAADGRQGDATSSTI